MGCARVSSSKHIISETSGYVTRPQTSQPKCSSCPDKQQKKKRLKRNTNKHCRYVKCMFRDKILNFVSPNIFSSYGFIRFKAVYALAVLCIVSCRKMSTKKKKNQWSCYIHENCIKKSLYIYIYRICIVLA